MADDREKTKKEEFVGRLEKAKGRLQQSFPEIQQRVRTSSAVEVAQSIFRQFADDIQLKDLLAKAEALVAKSDLVFTRTIPKATRPTQTFRDVTPPAEPSGTAGARKAAPKRRRLRKAASKKVVSKKKKPTPKRKTKVRS